MGSKVKQKHLLLLQKKVREKIGCLKEQRDILIATITDYVAQAETTADRLLATDPHTFMERYVDVMQNLDRCCNTCMLLTAQADDMIESSENQDEQSEKECSQSGTDDPQEGEKQDESPLSSSPGFEKDNDTIPRRSVDKYSPQKETSSELCKEKSLIVEQDMQENEKGSVQQCLVAKGSHLKIKGDALPLSLENKGDNSMGERELCKMDSPVCESEVRQEMENVMSSELCKDSRECINVNAVPVQEPLLELTADAGLGSNIEVSPQAIPSSPVKDDKRPSIVSQPATPSKWVDTETPTAEYGLGPVISHCTMTEGPVIPVIVSEIGTPWAFYVQQYGLALDKLRTSINLYQAQLQPGEATVDEPRAGMVCLAQFSADGLCYRAKIIKITERADGLLCDVIYVDYGNCESVRSSSLLQLPASLAELPSQAIFCSLSGVSPVNKLGLWTEDEVNGFRQHVIGQQLNCKATFVSTKQALSFPHLIELYLNFPIHQTDSRVGRVLISQVSLAAILVKRNLARPIPVSEQIAKLQNQFGELASPPSSKSPSPQKPLKCVQSKSDMEPKDPDVVMESSEIVYSKNERSVSRNEGSDSNTTAEASSANAATVGGKGVTNNDNKGAKPKIQPVVTSQETKTSTNSSHSLQSETPKHSIKGARKEKGDSEPSKLTGSTDSSENQSPCKSHDTSCLEGETTTSGITDMSINPLSTDQRDTPTEEYDVMIAHIVNPNDFYIHKITEDVGKTLERLMKDLNLHFERQSRKRLHKLYRSFTPKLNHLCCAQFSEDNYYYRGQIIGVKDAERKASKLKEDSIGKVRVFFIDFGDNEWLPRSKVFPLPEDFSCFPPLTVWCSLAHVQPVGEQWTDKSIQEFDQLAGSEKRLTMCVIEGQMPENNRCVVQTAPVQVFLVDVLNSEEEICINLELMRTGHAALIVSKEMNSPEDESDEDPVDLEWNQDWDPRVEDYISLRNSYNINTDDPGVATVGYQAKDERPICKFWYFNTPGQCWRGEYCHYKHVLNTGITGDQEFVYVLKDDQTEILPDEGTMVAVEITSILSPRHFYLTMPLGKTPIDQLRNKHENEEDHEETLEDLVRSMKATYHNRVFSHRDITLLAPGQAVAAKYVSGNQIGWYRAKVTDISPEEEKVEVYFVDFGHTEWVKEVDIQNLEPEFLHLPQQAIECFLVDLEPAGQDMQWSEASRNKFRVMVDGKTLVAQIRTRSWSGCLHLDLYDTSGQVDINIAVSLIQDGYAQRPHTDSENVNREQRAISPDIILVPG